MLSEVAGELFRRHCPLTAVRAWEEQAVECPAELYRELGRQGFLGLLVPESHGGAGLNCQALTAVAEAAGRALAPGPFLVSAALMPAVLIAAGTPAQQTRWLPRLAAGETHLALAWQETDADAEPPAVTAVAERTAGGYRLTGTKHYVAWGGEPGAYLVLARVGAGDGPLALFLAPGDSPAARQPVRIQSGEDLWSVHWQGARLPPDALLGSAGEGWALLEAALVPTRIAAAAYAVGAGEAALDLAVAYARERQQFGRPIGGFQAIQHKLADAASRVQQARLLTALAAWRHDQGLSARRDAAAALLRAGEAFCTASLDAIQVHGGYGFMVEYDIQLYYRRAKPLQLRFGTPAVLRRALLRHARSESLTAIPGLAES